MLIPVWESSVLRVKLSSEPDQNNICLSHSLNTHFYLGVTLFILQQLQVWNFPVSNVTELITLFYSEN